ncbi:bifunctional nicotinamidase/pyrazinamidase [Stieleria sp. ICT_E10.1]|uniref:bifunctional nicotinamidase/pyrazinamidase n=1 Tax=Stieleria sedimenti TaxID=2976331 RepID=UPI00217F2BFB|nr:bifunctional nicotinamidase/pyrazinamidase [Stieleria sedimenti]MCS7469479.1 bifunctional nicotinamidase/pyrazinamidase [Stieleria sedimenti]
MKSDTNTEDHRGLLLVDLQNDFVQGGALEVPGGLEVIDVANTLIPKFGWVVATQDWHPADHQSFASQHAGLAIGDQFLLDGIPQIAWPDHCIEHTRGAEFVASLNQNRIDHVVRKGTQRLIDSYSAFYDNGHQHSTGLADDLRGHGIEHVFAMGLATDYCVRATVLDAIREGFRVTLVVDGCRGVELQPGDIERSLEEMRDAGAELIRSDEL